MISRNEWVTTELKSIRRVVTRFMPKRLRYMVDDAVQYIIMQRLEGRIFPSHRQLLVDFFRAHGMDTNVKSRRQWADTEVFTAKHSPKNCGDYHRIDTIIDIERNFTGRKRTIAYLVLMGFTQEEIGREFNLTAGNINHIIKGLRLCG